MISMISSTSVAVGTTGPPRPAWRMWWWLLNKILCLRQAFLLFLHFVRVSPDGK